MKTVFLDFGTLHPRDLDTNRLQQNLTQLTCWDDTPDPLIVERLGGFEAVVVNVSFP